MTEQTQKPFRTRLGDWLTSPSTSVTEVGERRKVQLLASMTLTVGILNTLGAFFGDNLIPYALSVLLFIAYGISRTKLYRIGSWLVVIAISSSGFLNASLPDADPATSILSYIPLALVLGVGLLSQFELVILVVLTTGISFSMPAIVPTLSDPNVYGAAGLTMTLGALLLIVNNVQISVEKSRREDLIKANAELIALQSRLEQRVAERTKALETSAEVSRRLASILDPLQLASAVVNEVRNAYNYYYAQIYLFDDAGENLVLSAGTGEAGAEMMRRGHSLPRGRGLVGRAADTKASILVSDTSQDPNWLPNNLLPDTKAEAVVPIIIGDKVLGVLDVQDDVTNDIFPEDITLLESLAGQVAISLQNSESYARAEAARQEAQSLVDYAPEAIVVVDLTTGLFTDPNQNAEKLYGLSRDELLKVGPAQMSPPAQPDGRDSTEKAMEKIGEAMQGGTPIFEWMHRNGQGENIMCEIHLVRLPGDKPRVRATVIDITERKQLQDLTAMRARQQEAINTITQRIQSATTIEDAMQVAARELGHALGRKQTIVALEPSALGVEHNRKD